MSSSMPDRRRVSLAPVNTLTPSGIRSLIRARAAAASSRISTVNPCALSAVAACSRCWAGAGSANDVAGVRVVMLSPGLDVDVPGRKAQTGTDCGCRSAVIALRVSMTPKAAAWMCSSHQSDNAAPRNVRRHATSHSRGLSCRTSKGRTRLREAGETMTTNSGPGQGPTYPGLSVIMGERRQLINLTYRLLGSLAEAEDAVQETYARWYSMSRQKQDAIESPGAWLSTVASRICLNLAPGDSM